MSDGSAKHPRSFEPPPWERERFEELARRRAEREAADLTVPGPGAGGEASTAETPTRTAATPAEGAEAPDAEVMLMGLAGQEPRVFAWVWLAWLAAAGLFALLGVGTLVFGAVGLARAQGSNVATTWSFVLVLVGLASLGAAVWLTVRALGERGA